MQDPDDKADEKLRAERYRKAWASTAWQRSRKRAAEYVVLLGSGVEKYADYEAARARYGAVEGAELYYRTGSGSLFQYRLPKAGPGAFYAVQGRLPEAVAEAFGIRYGVEKVPLKRPIPARPTPKQR